MKWKRLGCLILTVLMLVSILPMESSAVTEQRWVTHHRLDTGVIFVWSDGRGNWQNGWKPGGTGTSSYTFSLGAGTK